MLLRRLGEFFLDLLEVIVFAIAIFLFIYLLIMQPHKIKGDSMQPNFPNGEYLLTDKLTYKFRDPKRGEVIVFEPPGVDDDEYIKRVIGLPGERISVKEGKVFINGKMLIEPYLSETVFTSGGNFLKDNQELLIPDGHFFVLGDNRQASSDSRSWGLVPKNRITGRAWIIYWPPPNVGLVEDVIYGFN